MYITNHPVSLVGRAPLRLAGSVIIWWHGIGCDLRSYLRCLSSNDCVKGHLFVSCSDHETYIFKSAFQFKYDIKAPTLTMSEKSIGHVDPSYSCTWSVSQWGRDFYKCAAIVITKQRLEKGDEPFVWDTIGSFTGGKIRRVLHKTHPK